MTERLTVTVAGCVDAFGTGGRMQSAYVIDTPEGAVLLDCGATTTTALARIGRNPNEIATVLISHLHGDHFGGLPWLLVQGTYATRRTTPLHVYGPPGIEARFHAAAEALFPGCTTAARQFTINFHELHVGTWTQAGPLRVRPFLASHPSGAPSYALRLERAGKVIAFTGDSEWVAALADCGRAADLYIMECYAFATPTPYHLTWTQIASRLDEIGMKQVMLTHMSADMLARRGEVQDPRVVLAEDGLVLQL